MAEQRADQRVKMLAVLMADEKAVMKAEQKAVN